MNAEFTPIWPALGTPPANALYRLGQGSFQCEIPVEDAEAKDWLSAIADLESMGWRITRRVIQVPAITLDILSHCMNTPVPAAIVVIDLEELSMQALADKFVSELLERP